MQNLTGVRIEDPGHSLLAERRYVLACGTTHSVFR